MIRSLSVSCLVLALFTGLGACGEASGPAKSGVVLDSAGVRIVESTEPSWSFDEAWRLGDRPILDLGRIDGPAETQFFRTSAGARLSDGSVVLGSFGTNDLRRFTEAGEHLWTVGREGQGPGEFAGLTQVTAGPGDTILTYDFRQRRFSRFAVDGTFLDSRPLDSPSGSGFGFVEALLPDGSAVFTWREFDREGGPPAEGEVSRDTISVRVAAGGSAETVDLGRFAGAETVVIRSGETDAGFSITIGSAPFGRSTEATGGPDGVWVGDTDRFDLRRYGFDGHLEMIARRAFDPVVVDDALVERAIAAEAEGEDDDRQRELRRRWEMAPLPEMLPAFETLLVDRTGHLWVQHFEAPGATERIWSVFSPRGEWLGEVAFPDRFRPLEIGNDYVLGRFGDELDVEHIQLWELLKPGA